MRNATHFNHATAIAAARLIPLHWVAECWEESRRWCHGKHPAN
ncbi:MAG: hypothetical protein Q8M11_15545 [Sulfuritalea sp.]|nr:hypothetical protein [Sulfuritalea sp.]